MKKIIDILSTELNRPEKDIRSAIQLLDEGATVPFIARYRKEMTGTMSDTELRQLNERLLYLRELQERREVILNSITEQDKLTSELKYAIEVAETKAVLEDLYLPFKPKRRTKAQLAREAGLEPLAMMLLENSALDPNLEAEKFLNPASQIHDVSAALLGARQILMEMMSEVAKLVGDLREYLWDVSLFSSEVISGKEQEAKRYTDYFNAQEKIKKIPSHRALAMFRGQKEGFLRLKLQLSDDQELFCLQTMANYFDIKKTSHPEDAWLDETLKQAFKMKLFPKLEIDLLMRLKNNAEQQAIYVFAENLKNLLMASPVGGKVVMGLDPGLRTGVKVAIVDQTGQFLDHATIYPHVPRKEWEQALSLLAGLCRKHQVQLISIGNGTASRETDKLVSELISKEPELKLIKVVVSEAGASVYSASELGAQEFPDLDVSFRGAVSIARRLQDPLAELVKIEPKAIGVGQYQHDVNQIQLARVLTGVVEDCVNAVGVDLNRASVSLLSRVAGLNAALAQQIVVYRNNHGVFKTRDALHEVPRLGPKAFEQAAGFLRIVDGKNPLDASAVHPEAYPLVEKIIFKTNKNLNEIIFNPQFLRTLQPEEFVVEPFGLMTVKDVLKELEKPGRDPRPEFKMAQFKEGVHEIAHLKIGMLLEGVVTNVTDFGAFIDIGVHQDGLVHKSEMAQHFVADPKTVVKAGQIVQVKVLQVDKERQRISLTMKLVDKAQQREKPVHIATKTKQKKDPQKSNSVFGELLNGALKDWKTLQK